METYHKISTPFKRWFDGPHKGQLKIGEWAQPEFKFLADNEWEFTEKVDGTNIRIQLHREEDTLWVEYRGRSDNAVIPTPLLDRLIELFPSSSPSRRATNGRDAIIGRWMIDNDLTNVLLFGEGYGPKIQGGGKYRDDHSFVLFDVKVGDWWLTRDRVNYIAETIEIDSVPVLGKGTLWDAIGLVKGDKVHYDAFAIGAKDVALGHLQSQWGEFEAEGIIAVPSVPLFNRKGERVITKIKAVDFR